MSKKKGYYLYSQCSESLGVMKKIHMQINELNKFYDVTPIEIEVIDRNIVERIIGLFPTASIKRKYEETLESIVDPQFIYVRRMLADREYLLFLRELRNRFPDVKILIELYTYPYDKDEFAKWNAWPFYLKELIYRNKQKKYIDRFVEKTEGNIFGVPTVHYANGIDVKSLPLVGGEFKENQINLMGVAYMQRHHGYERVILGLADYYAIDHTTKVTLDLVGDGPEKDGYIQLVNKYGLQEYVTFYPNTSGEELEKIYNKCDIGIASLGMYKLNLYKNNSVLKTREYLAKGMLMLLGCEIDVIDDTYKYAVSFPNDDSPIDISKVVEFYNGIYNEYGDKRVVAEYIRDFAMKTVDNSVVMKNVIEYIG